MTERVKELALDWAKERSALLAESGGEVISQTELREHWKDWVREVCWECELTDDEFYSLRRACLGF